MRGDAQKARFDLLQRHHPFHHAVAVEGCGQRARVLLEPADLFLAEEGSVRPADDDGVAGAAVERQGLHNPGLAGALPRRENRIAVVQ